MDISQQNYVYISQTQEPQPAPQDTPVAIVQRKSILQEQWLILGVGVFVIILSLLSLLLILH